MRPYGDPTRRLRRDRRFVDRLLMPEAETRPEEEELYNQFATELDRQNQEGSLRQWFTELFSAWVQPGQVLEEADIESLEVLLDCPELDRLRKAYDYNYQRPVLRLSIVDYQALCKKIGKGLASRGFATKLRMGMQEMSLIVATDDSDNIYHELRHAVDRERSGPDKILEEFYAYFGELLHPRQMKVRAGGQVNVHTIKTNIKAIASSIGSNETDRQNLCPQMSAEEFSALAEEVGGILEELIELYSVEEVDVMLHNSRQIADLKRVLDFKKRELQ